MWCISRIAHPHSDVIFISERSQTDFLMISTVWVFAPLQTARNKDQKDITVQ